MAPIIFFQLRVSDKVDTINYEIMQLLKGKLCTYNNKTTFECEDEIFLSRKKKKKNCCDNEVLVHWILYNR